VTSVRSCEKLPLSLIETMPVGSKTDLLMAKAETISDGDRACVITSIRSKKKPCALAVRRKK